MGAGATAGVAVRVAAASDADLQVAVSGLTADSRGKLLAAIGETGRLESNEANTLLKDATNPTGNKGSLNVTVGSVSGAENTISVDPDATVFDLQKAIEVASLCPMPCQRLILGTKELRDSGKKIADLECLELMLLAGVSHGILEIHVNTGDVVNYVCLKRRDGSISECGTRGFRYCLTLRDGSISTTNFGCIPAGNREPFLLEPNEYITEVAWWREDYYGAACIKGVRFTTNTGRTSGIYGKDGQSWQSERAPQGQQISGLRMKPDHHGFVSDILEVIIE